MNEIRKEQARMKMEGTDNNFICYSCGADKGTLFYTVRNIPVNSVIQISSRDAALSYPRGDIIMGYCNSCEFIFNIAYDPKLTEYSEQYESTQSYSETFNSFNRQMAEALIQRFELHNKDVIEIGCGNGEFLTMLCEMGDNRCIGFDPAYSEGRIPLSNKGCLKFIKDFYSEKYSSYRADFVVCKMTLEHIQKTAEFIQSIRSSLSTSRDALVFFQVPNTTLILNEMAFWDIYYEHCSYFSEGSLKRLFRKCGFQVIDLWKDYNEQYLMIVAKRDESVDVAVLENEEEIKELERIVNTFSKEILMELQQWRDRLNVIKQKHQRAAIWGGGSKGVAFLSTLNIKDEIKYAVDINPHKEGKFIAGTGQMIVSPEFLKEYKPDIVIVMNPVYRDEIADTLKGMRLKTQLLTV